MCGKPSAGFIITTFKAIFCKKTPTNVQGKQIKIKKKDLIQRFLPYRSQLLEWTKQTKVPLFFSEVGYPSHDRALETPWDQHRGTRVDMETQKSGYEAFIATFSGDQQIRGILFYALHEDGGQTDRGYTPAGKPAIETLRRYFRDRSENSDGLRSRP